MGGLRWICKRDMKMNRVIKKLSGLLILSLALAACDAGDGGFQVVDVSHGTTGDTTDSGGTQTAAIVQTLAIQPAYTKITGIGKTLQLSADIWLFDGDVVNDVQKSFTTTDGTDDQILSWETENFGVATVDENGLVTTVSAGDTFIKATIDGHEALARVIVEAESLNDPNIDVSPSP
jgi:Big-like domain-containing protein